MDEESFELLSSMSPNVKHCQKHFRKGTIVLALRKSLQKSSIYDKSVHTGKNDELIVTEASSTSTSESSSSKSTKSNKKLLNTTPISIHDSDSEDEPKPLLNKCESPEITNHVNVKSTHKVERRVLSRNKFDDIQHWIENVNLQSELKDCTTLGGYSELSTIYGDENNKNFMAQKTGRAINSTVIGSSSVHFEDLFKQKTESITRRKFKNINDDQVIDESFLEHDRNVIKEKVIVRNTVFTINDSTNSEKSVISSSSKASNNINSLNNAHRANADYADAEVGESEKDIIDSDDSFSLNESLSTRLKNKNQIISTAKNTLLSNSSEEYSNCNLDSDVNEVASMLDDFYGNKWREKEELVLPKTPKTEPKKKVLKPNNLYVNNSERKPKLSVLYKNPYLETEKSKSNNLIQTLQKSRLKSNMESAAIRRFNNLCDSDTDSNCSDVQTKPRARLNFDDSDCDDEITSKYFKDMVVSNKKTVPETESKKGNESDKENLDDLSLLGQTLEERIKKKMNGIKDISEKKKKGKKGPQDKIPLTKKCNTDSNVTDKKTDKTSKKRAKEIQNEKSSSSSDASWEEEMSKIVHETKPVDGKYSFLASLSANISILQCDMAARMYRNNFKQYKEQLLVKLFKLYNEKVFENAIPQDTMLEWNDRMRGTAGFCYCKKITRRTGAVERTARIVLSTKVIDAPYRLRDTLIHEMCHAATWIVNCVSDGHGPYWKSWACKAMRTFPELPPIKRCHDYVINTKYTYKCTRCGYSIGRHSKSLDIERKRCGHCLGKFEILLNKVTKKGETKSVPATPKKEATGFALFVKENYSVYKKTDLKHGEVMKLLGQKFQEMKVKAS